MDSKALKFAILFEIFMTVWLIHNASPNNAALIKFTNFVCENVNTKMFQINQCRLKAVKRDVATLNFNATLLEPAHKIRVTMELFKKANGYKPWLYKVDIDGCRYLRKTYNPIALVIFGDFMKFSNINHSCPYQGPVWIQGFYLRSEVIGLPLPTGDYLADSEWYFNQQLTLKAKYYFTYVEDLKGQ